jgi:hypothetical protein
MKVRYMILVLLLLIANAVSAVGKICRDASIAFSIACSRYRSWFCNECFSSPELYECLLLSIAIFTRNTYEISAWWYQSGDRSYFGLGSWCHFPSSCPLHTFLC